MQVSWNFNNQRGQTRNRPQDEHLFELVQRLSAHNAITTLAAGGRGYRLRGCVRYATTNNAYIPVTYYRESWA